MPQFKASDQQQKPYYLKETEQLSTCKKNESWQILEIKLFLELNENESTVYPNAGKKINKQQWKRG